MQSATVVAMAGVSAATGGVGTATAIASPAGRAGLAYVGVAGIRPPPTNAPAPVMAAKQDTATDIIVPGTPAPGFEQLELHKYGFRMNWDPMDPLTPEATSLACTDGWRRYTDKDMGGWGMLGGMLGSPPYTKELLRSTFWCPPHPPEVEVTDDNVPYMQVYKEHQPEIWSPELRQGTMFDIMDEYCETDHWKTAMAYAAWASGAAGHWEGVAIPAIHCVQLLILTNTGRTSYPRGGLHGYFHAIHRAAVHRGAVVRTSCPVDEILIAFTNPATEAAPMVQRRRGTECMRRNAR